MNENFDVTICVPMFNAQPWLDRWFEAVLAQKCEFSYSVYIVDSGSTDNTLEILHKWKEKYPDRIQLEQIPNGEFGHGKTRNYLVSKVQSEFVVFTVQDAIPVDSDWLQALVDGIKLNERIAAAFGRHYANPGANPVMMRQIDKTFDDYVDSVSSLKSAVVSDGYYYFTDPAEIKNWDKFLAFSNVNSAYRTDVLKQIKFRDIDFAEDRWFMKDVVSQRYWVVFADKAVVYHSHDFGLVKTLRKQYDEWKAISDEGSYPYKFRWYHVFTQAGRGYLRDLEFIFKSSRLSILRKFTGIFEAFVMEVVVKLGMFLGLNYKSVPRWVTARISHQYTWRQSSKMKEVKQ